MGLTRNQAIAAAWDANVAAVQAAKTALTSALSAYGEASRDAGDVTAPLRRKALMGPLTASEVAQIDAAEEAAAEALRAVGRARAQLAGARRRFKGGVTADQISDWERC